MTNLGKQWELKVKEDFSKIPGSTIDRLYDPVGGFYGIRNISDFIAYCYPIILYIECKETKGNTFNFSKLSQYDKLLTKKGIKGVRAGVLLWFSEKDVVIWAPIEEIEKMKINGLKSINVKNIKEKVYNIIEIPSIKKRVFMECDYSILVKEEMFDVKKDG